MSGKQPHKQNTYLHIAMESQSSSMATKEEHCRLENLESEILLNITTHVPDLLSLRSLLHASPATFRLFEAYGSYITDCVSNNDPMSGEILEMIRALAYIRSATLPMPDLDTFITEVVIGSKQRSRVPNDYEGFIAAMGIDPNSDNPRIQKVLTRRRTQPVSDQEPFVLPYLPKNISPRILHNILGLVLQISRLTPACLQHYLSRLMTIETYHPIDERFIRDPHTAWDDWRSAQQHQPGSLNPPEGKKYEIQDAGPPSWLEGQRVAHSFWRLRVFFDLKIMGAKGRLNWPAEDVEKLKNMHHSEMFDNPPRGPLTEEEINTVLEWLQEFGEYDSISNPFDTDFPTNLPHLDEKFNLPTQAPSPRDRVSVSTLTDSIILFSSATRFNVTPLYGVPFDPFRRLGFALWDKKRMSYLGLDDPPLPPGGNSSSLYDLYFFAWRSILSAEDHQALEANRNALATGTTED